MFFLWKKKKGHFKPILVLGPNTTSYTSQPSYVVDLPCRRLLNAILIAFPLGESPRGKNPFDGSCKIRPKIYDTYFEISTSRKVFADLSVLLLRI